jgi:hypothetical protein
MLLATLSLVITPLARISGMLDLPFSLPVGGMLLSDLFLAALVAFDVGKRGKLQSATLWAGGAYLVTQPLRWGLGQTEMWQSFARGLIG